MVTALAIVLAVWVASSVMQDNSEGDRPVQYNNVASNRDIYRMSGEERNRIVNENSKKHQRDMEEYHRQRREDQEKAKAASEERTRVAQEQQRKIASENAERARKEAEEAPFRDTCSDYLTIKAVNESLAREKKVAAMSGYENPTALRELATAKMYTEESFKKNKARLKSEKGIVFNSEDCK